MMTSTKYSLITLEDLFKINWILFLNIQFGFLGYFFLYITQIKGMGDFQLKTNTILYISFIVSIVLNLFFKLFKIINNKISFIFLFFYFFIFLFFYFFIIEKGDVGNGENTNSLFLLFLFLMFALFLILHAFVSIPVFFKLYSNVLKSMRRSKDDVLSKIFLLLIVGFLYVVSLNLVYFTSKGLYILGAIFLFYFILYKYLIKYILAHFKWFLVVNFILLFLPFFVLYMTKMSFFSHQIFLVNNYNNFSLIFGEKFIDKLLLLSPYQTVVFPLFFNFNAYIIAQKMLEVKYPNTTIANDFKPRLRPEFKTEQERKDWYDNNY